MKFNELTDYFYEIFQLKRVKHNGWYKANVENPDSVAEHALLAAQIGYILANIEGADANKVLKMLVFHDNAEVRVGDMDKVHCRYIRNKIEIEKTALVDQVANLSDFLKKEMVDGFDEMEAKETLEALIVKDADYLEQAFQAMIYKSQGNEGVQNWLDNISKALKTDSAKKLFAELIKTSPNKWFVELKYFGNRK